jgi:hypothetical protein
MVSKPPRRVHHPVKYLFEPSRSITNISLTKCTCSLFYTHICWNDSIRHQWVLVVLLVEFMAKVLMQMWNYRVSCFKKSVAGQLGTVIL